MKSCHAVDGPKPPHPDFDLLQHSTSEKYFQQKAVPGLAEVNFAGQTLVNRPGDSAAQNERRNCEFRLYSKSCGLDW